MDYENARLVDADAHSTTWTCDMHLKLESQRRVRTLYTTPLDRSFLRKIAPFLRSTTIALHRDEGARAVYRLVPTVSLSAN